MRNDNFKISAIGCFIHITMEIYTDGSFVPGPNEICYGGIGVFFGDDDKRNISESIVAKNINHQTMELMAILRAFQCTMGNKNITILTDSQSTVVVLNDLYKKREKKDWKKGNGKYHPHHELCVQCRDAVERRNKLGYKTTIKYTRGHMSIGGNHNADKLAGLASHRFIPNTA